jgi:hypothetical protein
LIDIIANAPAKVNAFISTIIEIAQHYNLTRESFFWLFAFVSAHTNYFEDLEQKSYSFSNRFMLIWRFKFIEELTAILIEEYGYTMKNWFFGARSVGRFAIYFCSKSKTLLLSKDIDEPQKPLY